MNSEQLFAMALGVSAPWKITDVAFKGEGLSKELHIHINFDRGTKFLDQIGEPCEVYDTKHKQWRHLNFFQHACYLHCRVPRVKASDGTIKLVEVPWSRPGSGFTLLFEAYVMALIESEMPVDKIGKLLSENPHRVWTIFNYWIEKAYDVDEPSRIKKLGIDETSKRKGHDYVTLAVDIDERRVLHVTEGKDKTAVKRLKNYLESKWVKVSQIEHVSMDMSASFIEGVGESFPDAEVHFDRFHVVKLLNEAMDEVRKKERKGHAELKGHKYTFLKRQAHLTEAQQGSLSELIKLYPKLGAAYRLKELLNYLWEMESAEEATAFLEDWCEQVEAEKIVPFIKFAKTVKAHWSGIVNFCETKINNGILEGINTKVQLAKTKSEGLSTLKEFYQHDIFFVRKLKFDYPLVSS